jgi:hypothetical protein
MVARGAEPEDQILNPSCVPSGAIHEAAGSVTGFLLHGSRPSGKPLRMRTSVLFAALATLFFAPLAAQAGRLDIAVIQFTDKRDTAMIAEALRSVDLPKITDSDRTETKVKGLSAGWVIFTQSLNVSPGGKFASSTRLTNQRADVSGSLHGSDLSVQVTILEGVKIGLRKYRQNSYAGSGSVAGGVPQLIAVNRSTGKTANSRGRVSSFDFTTIIAAVYTP